MEDFMIILLIIIGMLIFLSFVYCIVTLFNFRIREKLVHSKFGYGVSVSAFLFLFFIFIYAFIAINETFFDNTDENSILIWAPPIILLFISIWLVGIHYKYSKTEYIKKRKEYYKNELIWFKKLSKVEQDNKLKEYKKLKTKLYCQRRLLYEIELNGIDDLIQEIEKNEY